MLRNLQTSHVEQVGYANLRCTWSLGCPSAIKPHSRTSKLEAFLEPNNDRANTAASYEHAWNELFSGNPVPKEIGVQCGGQFALARWKVLERPRSEYQRIRQWIKNTPLRDAVSGRVMEYSWHCESISMLSCRAATDNRFKIVIMGMTPIYCPYAQDCFCKLYGLCNLTCTDDSCAKRYKMPPRAQIPEDWPIGAGQHGLPANGWWE